MRFVKNQITGFVEATGVMRDITERKQAEEALRESELKFKVVTETVKDVFWISTCDVREIVYISPAYETLWERSRESLYQSPKSFVEAIHPDDIEGYLGMLDKYRKNGTPYEYEYRIIRRDGEIRWIYEKGYPVPDSSNDEPRMAGVCTDITEQKRTEQRLREAILRQEQAVKAGNVGLWDWDLLTNRVRYSAEWKRQIGYEEDEISDDFEEWQSRVHPDDLEATLKKVRQSIAEKRLEHKVEFRFRHRDGSYRWILAPGSILQDENGRPIRMLGSHIDMTERKRAEEELRKSERLHREAQRIAKIGHWELDSPSGTPTWSEEIFHIFGLDPESSEPSFAAHVNIIHGEDWDLLDRSIQELNTNGTPVSYTHLTLPTN